MANKPSEMTIAAITPKFPVSILLILKVNKYFLVKHHFGVFGDYDYTVLKQVTPGTEYFSINVYIELVCVYKAISSYTALILITILTTISSTNLLQKRTIFIIRCNLHGQYIVREL